MSQIKQQIDLVLNQAMNQVQDAFPSIYSKADVQTLLINISKQLEALKYETESKVGLTIPEIIECIECVDINEFIDVDYSSAEFSIDGNYIELADVDNDFDTRRFISQFESELKSAMITKEEQMNELINETQQ